MGQRMCDVHRSICRMDGGRHLLCGSKDVQCARKHLLYGWERHLLCGSKDVHRSICRINGSGIYCRLKDVQCAQKHLLYGWERHLLCGSNDVQCVTKCVTKPLGNRSSCRKFHV